MFGRKTTAQEANKDRELLLQAMDKMIAGDFSMVSSEGFSDPIYADKLNQIGICNGVFFRTLQSKTEDIK